MRSVARPIASITRGLSLPSAANSPSVSRACSNCSAARHQERRVIAGGPTELGHVADPERARLEQVLERPVVLLQPEFAQPEKRVGGAVLRREAKHAPERVAALRVIVERVVGRALIPEALHVVGLQFDRLARRAQSRRPIARPVARRSRPSRPCRTRRIQPWAPPWRRADSWAAFAGGTLSADCAKHWRDRRAASRSSTQCVGDESQPYEAFITEPLRPCPPAWRRVAGPAPRRSGGR